MKFCKICRNMLYIKNENENLVYYCKNCNFVENNVETAGQPVVDSNLIDDDMRYSQYMTKNIKHDPSLPRVNNIKCPSEHCTKKPNQDDEVIYVKYEFHNMKYLYFCCHCEAFWKSN